MMILFALLYLSFGSSFALPTHPDIPINISPSLFARDTHIFGTRSIWNIIWSCFSTIFACTWIAVHPNIPAPNDSQWDILRRRLAIMGYVLIAPEIVVLWAARQHFGAKYFAKRHQKRGWTITHAFFVIMGGFTLHDERGTPLRILQPNELESLSEAGRIKWPSITEAEIQDRSKGDHFSKGIVLIQTSWFITQCIVRGAYQLEVTALEVVTVAFAALAGVIYYLWWHKPLGVRCSVPVYLLKDDEKEKVSSENTSSVSPDSNQVYIPLTISSDSNSNSADSQSSTINEETQIPQENLIAMSDLERNSQDSSQSSHNNSTPSEFQSTGMCAFIQEQRQKRGTVFGLIYVFFSYPILSFLRGFIHMRTSKSLNDSMPLRVPTFYAATFTDYDPGDGKPVRIVKVCVAIVFGGIHCVAWFFHFPTPDEQSAWRLSAVVVALLPVLFFVLGGLLYVLAASRQGFARIITAPWVQAGVLLYIAARIILLILPCIALRALDPAALVEIQWTTFFLHIS